MSEDDGSLGGGFIAEDSLVYVPSKIFRSALKFTDC